MKIPSLLFAIPIFLIMLTFGCKSADPAQKPTTRKGITAKEILKENEGLQFNFNQITLKGKGDFEGAEQSFSFTYKITLLKDSLIWVSITKFGYEALRVKINPDSVWMKVTDRKELITCDLSIISGLTGFSIDFEQLQNLLVGTTNLFPKVLELSETGKTAYRLSGKEQQALFHYYFEGKNYQLSKMEVRDETNDVQTSITYRDFGPENEKGIPHTLLLEVIKPKVNKLQLDHGKIEIDLEPVGCPFKIPENYELKGCPNQK